MIIHWECLEEMDKLIEQWIKVDAIITDPPYGTTKCSRDSVIPFEAMRERLNKLIKPNGAIVLFGSEPFSSALRMSNIKHYKYDWIFHKTLPVWHGYAKYRPMSNHENISVFGNGKILYNPQFTPREKPRTYLRKNASTSWSSSMGSHDNKTRVLNGKYPTTIQKFNTSVQRGKVHPTQKPVALMEYLIKTYSHEWELILDFTAWSWSTLVAAKNTNRKYIWIEMEEKYINTIKERLK